MKKAVFIVFLGILFAGCDGEKNLSSNIMMSPDNQLSPQGTGTI